MKEIVRLDATCIILHLEEKSIGKKVNATIDLSINLVIVFYIVWLENFEGWTFEVKQIFLIFEVIYLHVNKFLFQ